MLKQTISETGRYVYPGVGNMKLIVNRTGPAKMLRIFTGSSTREISTRFQIPFCNVFIFREGIEKLI